MAYDITQSVEFLKASSQYAGIADNASLSITGNIVIEGWINMKEALTSGQSRCLVVKSNLSSSNRSYELLYQNVGGTNRLYWYFFGNGVPTNFYENYLNYTLTQDTWIHVAMICTVANPAATKVEWVINGVSQGNGTGTNFGTGATSIFNNTLAFRLAQSDPTTPGYFPDVRMSLVRVWSGLRTASEISNNMCNVLGATTNLQGEWKLNGDFLDNSGNGNDLTGSGSPSFVSDFPAVCGTAASPIQLNTQSVSFARKLSVAAY